MERDLAKVSVLIHKKDEEHNEFVLIADEDSLNKETELQEKETLRRSVKRMAVFLVVEDSEKVEHIHPY